MRLSPRRSPAARALKTLVPPSRQTLSNTSRCHAPFSRCQTYRPTAPSLPTSGIQISRSLEISCSVTRGELLLPRRRSWYKNPCIFFSSLSECRTVCQSVKKTMCVCVRNKVTSGSYSAHWGTLGNNCFY
ncbi:hypothetical protein XELAEV_18038304mg [Xenopus laevis]|uniref:Uncharacterized protein n=1 Tax=Xenopus laevis TaxID=8355 RepID=A0A974H7C4_XENLA|nr:hypothetical protein XELAEV_18038304mg [Xenopus laevis]